MKRTMHTHLEKHSSRRTTVTSTTSYDQIKTAESLASLLQLSFSHSLTLSLPILMLLLLLLSAPGTIKDDQLTDFFYLPALRTGDPNRDDDALLSFAKKEGLKNTFSDIQIIKSSQSSQCLSTKEVQAAAAADTASTWSLLLSLIHI